MMKIENIMQSNAENEKEIVQRIFQLVRSMKCLTKAKITLHTKEMDMRVNLSEKISL